MRFGRDLALKMGSVYFENLEKRKIVFQFVLMMLSSVFAGIFLTKFLSSEYLFEISKKISFHFGANIDNENLIYDIINIYFRLCAVDIICIIIVFLSSFSVLNYLINDGILIFLGMRYGINSALLAASGVLAESVGNSLSFWILRGIALIAIAVYCCRMAFYSLSFRSFSRNGKLIIKRKDLLSSTVFTLTMTGLILLINGLYCIFVLL